MTDRRVPTAADVDTEEDPRFVPWEEAKKFCAPKELEQHEVLAAKIKRIVAETKAVREAMARLHSLQTTGRPN